MSKSSEGNDGETRVIGEATPVRIGLIIAFLAVFASAIWWASSINSKLDSILASQTITTTSITELKAADLSIDKDINDIKLKIALHDVAIKALSDNKSSVRN